MGKWDAIVKGAEKKIEKKIEEAPGEIAKKAGEKVRENLWGRVCTWAISDEKNANRCKALSRLPDIASDGTKAVGSCLAAETGIGVLACGYYSAKTADSTGAMVTQMKTGEETKTLQEQGQDYGLEKAKEAGAYVKRKMVDEPIQEMLSADERRFLANNPGATHQDWVRMQNDMDALDDGTYFQ